MFLAVSAHVFDYERVGCFGREREYFLGVSEWDVFGCERVECFGRERVECF